MVIGYLRSLEPLVGSKYRALEQHPLTQEPLVELHPLIVDELQQYMLVPLVLHWGYLDSWVGSGY